MAYAQLIVDAEKHGLYQKQVVIGDRRGTKWACKCSRCGIEKIWPWPQATGIPFMFKLMNRTGWQSDKNGRHVCDDCLKKEAAEARRKVTKLEQVSNPKLQRKVFSLLDDHFNETTRVYDSGWSDKKIADEAQTSEQFVESLRRGAYGELAEDPAITALRGEVDKLADEARKSGDTLMSIYGDLEKKVAELRSRVDSLAVKRRVG